jgi:putative DNA-binding protein
MCLRARARGRVVSLDETQRLFLRAIRWPTGVADFLAQADAATREAFARTFCETAELGRVARVDVYANAYFYRLLDALRELFPRLCALAGDEPFHDLVTDYLLVHPPSEPDLRHAGDALPDFVARHALSERAPMAADVARVEQALNHALDAPQGRLIERAALAIIEPTAWPDLTFELSPPTRLIPTAWDVAEVAERLATGAEAARGVERAGARLLFLAGRRGFSTYFRRLAGAEAVVLERLAAGDRFGLACEAAAEAEPGVELGAIAAALGRWLDDGAIAAINRG